MALRLDTGLGAGCLTSKGSPRSEPYKCPLRAAPGADVAPGAGSTRVQLTYTVDEIRPTTERRQCNDCGKWFWKGTRMRVTEVQDPDDGKPPSLHYWCLQCTETWDAPEPTPYRE